MSEISYTETFTTLPDEETEPVAVEPESEPEPVAVVTPADVDASAFVPDRRGRGDLEAQVKAVCDDFVNGRLVLPADEVLTPHRVARQIKTKYNLDKAPSTGAVSGVFKRWDAYGYAAFTAAPFAFSDYTDAGRTEGLAKLKADYRAARKGADVTPEVESAEEPSPVIDLTDEAVAVYEAEVSAVDVEGSPF